MSIVTGLTSLRMCVSVCLVCLSLSLCVSLSVCGPVSAERRPVSSISRAVLVCRRITHTGPGHCR